MAGNLLGGQGWNPGSPNRLAVNPLLKSFNSSLHSHRKIAYTASNFTSNSTAYLSVYGWTTDPSIEYYIVESWERFNPITSGVIPKGSITTDGSIYDLGVLFRYGWPTGLTTYYSVRRDQRTSGTVDVSKHVEGWVNVGLNIGTGWDYQIVACEGYHSVGHCNVTVSEVPDPSVTESSTGASTTTSASVGETSTATSATTSSSPSSTLTSTSKPKPTPTKVTPPPPPPPTETCAPKGGQCGGITYRGPLCCQKPSKCVYINERFVSSSSSSQLHEVSCANEILFLIQGIAVPLKQMNRNGPFWSRWEAYRRTIGYICPRCGQY